MSIRVLFLTLVCFCALNACADIIVFKSGQELDCQILEKTPDSVKVAVEFQGTILIPMDRILRIDVETAEQAEARKKKKDAESAEAAKMKAEGMVKYKGEWVSEEDKKDAEEKLAEERKKKKEIADAKRKADEAVAKANDLAKQAQNLASAAENTGQGNDRGSRFNRTHGSRDAYSNSYGSGNNNGLQNSPYGGAYQNNYGGNSNFQPRY